jgi:DNA-binding Lrp family transcriptional regulator
MALPVGEALASHPETSWVKMTSGGTEIVAVVRGPTQDGSGSPLLEKLPRTRNVLDVSANCMLHMFCGGTRSAIHALTDDQIAALRPLDAESSSSIELDEVDTTILRLLAEDGRAEIDYLTKMSGIAATTLRRRMRALCESGVLYFDVDVDYHRLGLPNQTILWLTVSPHALKEAGSALAVHPELSFAAATTGATNIYANVLCRDAPALYEYLTTKIAALPGLQSVESAPVIRTLKRL